MSPAKIHLSTEELQLVQNAQLLLTKNNIIEKVYELFGQLAASLQREGVYPQTPITEELLSQSAKISRGEKYKGLPYVMLDYPRSFGKEDIFAVRTFFWWGNFFSVTLHLKGKYQQWLMPLLQKHSAQLAENNFRLIITGEEWEHDIPEEDSLSLSEYEHNIHEGKLSGKTFYKLCSRVDLRQWNEMNEILLRLHRVLTKAITG